MRRSLPILLLLTFAACATAPSTRPQGVAQPDINARLTNPLFFGSGLQAPATIELTVTNRAKVPIIVRRIELDSPGMAQYAIGRYVREHNETVNPGESKAITAFATAYVQTTTRVSEPLTIRAIVHFRSGDKQWREILIQRE